MGRSPHGSNTTFLNLVGGLYAWRKAAYVVPSRDHGSENASYADLTGISAEAATRGLVLGSSWEARCAPENSPAGFLGRLARL